MDVIVNEQTIRTVCHWIAPRKLPATMMIYREPGLDFAAMLSLVFIGLNTGITGALQMIQEAQP